MPVRKGTKQVIVGLIFRTAGLTRAEIADAAELSRPTVSAAVKELIADGVLTEEAGEAGPGRTPARLVLAPPPGIVAAIELAPDYEVIALSGTGKPQVTLGPPTLPGAVARLGRLLARNRLPAERLRAVVVGTAELGALPERAAGRGEPAAAPAITVGGRRERS